MQMQLFLIVESSVVKPVDSLVNNNLDLLNLSSNLDYFASQQTSLHALEVFSLRSPLINLMPASFSVR